MTKDAIITEVKRIADLLKVDTADMSDAVIYSIVTGVTLTDSDLENASEDRLGFLYKLIPVGAKLDSADSVDEEESTDEVVDDTDNDATTTTQPEVTDDEDDTDNDATTTDEPEVGDDDVTPGDDSTTTEPEVEPVKDDEKSEATVEE